MLWTGAIWTVTITNMSENPIEMSFWTTARENKVFLQQIAKVATNGKKWGKNKTASKETETEDVKIMLNAHPNV